MTEAALNATLTATSFQSKAERPRLRAFNALGNLVTGLMVVLGSFVLILAVATRLSTSDEYTLFGHPALVVLSGSMTPTIDTGDLVIDKPDPGAANLQKGQIITFYDSPGSATVLTHRIIQVVYRDNQVFYRTKGDANAAADPVLRPSTDVIGTYEMRVPWGGYLLTDIRKPIVLGLLLAAPILWLIAGLMHSWATVTGEPTSTARKQDTGLS